MEQYQGINPFQNNNQGPGSAMNNSMGMNPMNPNMGNYPGYITGANQLYQPNPLNPFNQNIPNNLNYSLPNQIPNQGNYSSGNINPFGGMNNLNQVGAGFNPFDRNENFLIQNRNNSMMGMGMGPNFIDQNIQNNANFMNEAEIKRNEYLEGRMKERDKMKEITRHLKDRLSGKYISNQEILDKEDEEERKRQREKEKEKEDDEAKKKNFREERQKNREMRFNQGLSDQPFDIYIPQSEYFFCRDRAFLNELILAPLKSAGFFGTKYLTDYDKSSLFDDKEAFKPQNAILLNDEDEYFERAIKDGIYLDYIKQQLFSYNIQKTEQRAFREVKKEWFRPNGDIRMDNDIFSDVVTKPIDISLSSSDQFDTFVPNSMFSGRNSSKMRTFKLRIIIGKIIFKKHPCFSEEDKIASDLVQCHKDFYSTMNMLSIPYLKEKIANITMKLNAYNSIHIKTDTQETEIKNMNTFLKEAYNYLANEKDTINRKANNLYNKWLDLKQIRKQQNHQNTNIKLNVIRFNSENNRPNIYDYAFILTNSEVIDTGSIVPKEERNRREKVPNNMVYIKVYINGVYAFETKPSEIKWPNYEVEINSQFLMLLYTRPTKFEIELYINKKIVKKFQAEPPGMFSKTVTSSASLMEEINFGSGDDYEEENEQQINKLNEELNASQKKGEISEDQKLLIKDDNEVRNLNIENNKIDGEQIEGSIYLKTEWDGRAPDLPPTKIEDKLELVNKQIAFQELIRKYNDLDYPFDVNDPRNVAFVEEVKKKKLGMMLRFVYKEYLLTYFDVQSTRHYLLLKRLEKRSIKDLKFPILEAQIEKSEKMRKIIEELKEQEAYMAEEEEERKKKIKQGIEDLKKKYGDIRTDEDYQKWTKDKINLMKKDKITQEAYGYPQIISEAEIYSNPILFFKEFFRRVFTRARKLAPLRTKPTPVKVENTNKIKVNIHVVKGYNIPVRVYAYPQAIIDNQKLKSVGCYVQTLRDVFLADNNRLNVIRNSQSIQEMAGINAIINNSAAFSNNRASNNNSFSLDMNNRNMYGYNPNFADIMHNPNGMGGMGRPYGGRENDEQNIERNIERLNKMQNERVNSFIEVKVSYYDQEGVFRTDSIASIHPDYNHQFEFYIYPKDGKENFTKDELAQCPGCFYFTLYDELISSENKTVNGVNIFTQIKKRKYLGSFQIPFSTVFQNCSVLDTICKINIPKTVFGYYSDPTSIFNIEDTEEDIEEENPEQIEINKVNNQFNAIAGIGALPSNFGQDAGIKDIFVEHIINPFLNSYLSLYITLDPVPNFTAIDETSYVSGHEKMLLLSKGTEWLKSLKEKKLYKHRSIKLFVQDFNNSSVFISRYLVKEGQVPPDFFCDKNDEMLIEKIAKFVSLIPFIDDNTAMETAEDMPDCWCNDNEFLTLGFGDYEEHAILLCNYFNYIDQLQENGCQSFLVLGDAHPEGNTVYVLRATTDFKEIELWNAKTGDCFYFDKTLVDSKMFCCTITQHYKKTKSIFDQICPLKSVGSIISYDNVYVNAQEESDPSLIDFNIKEKGKWKPFLDKELSQEFFKDGVETIQLPLTYADKYGENIEQKKSDIRDYLVERIKEIRINENQLPTEGLSRENSKIVDILAKYELYSFTTPKSEINLNRKIKASFGGQLYSPDEFDKKKNEQKKGIRDKLLSDLQELEKEIKDEFSSSDEIYGFPINLPYTTKKEIWEQIKLTNVHLIAGGKSQLNLSIYIEAFPNDIYSVWIFLAILSNRNY